MNPTAGRIVHYTLTAGDAEQVNRRRTTGGSIADRMKQEPPAWPAGAQAHIGNQAQEGHVLPMLVVRVWSPDTGCVNGQVFLDGNDTLWATSAIPGDGPGQWRWPPREGA